jgi:hypothetical protein
MSPHDCGMSILPYQPDDHVVYRSEECRVIAVRGERVALERLRDGQAIATTEASIRGAVGKTPVPIVDFAP